MVKFGRTKSMKKLLSIGGILGGIITVTVALLSFVLNWSGYRFSRIDAESNRLQRLSNAQIDQSKELSTLLYEYRDLSYLFFFQEVASWKPDYMGDRERKHSEYHRLLAEVNSKLETIPFYFGDCVRSKTDRLLRYLGQFQWESIIQGKDFRDKEVNLAGESLTDLISRSIFIEQFDILANELRTSMAAEIASELKKHAVNETETAICSEAPSEPVAVISKHEISVGEEVTITMKNSGGTGLWSYDSYGDEGFKSDRLPVVMSFKKPGKKNVNIVAKSVKKDGERQTIVGYSFVHEQIEVK